MYTERITAHRGEMGMSDLNAMNRERKKEQLRQQIVSNQTAADSSKKGTGTRHSESGRPYERYSGEEEVKTVKKAHRRVIRKRAAIAAAILLLLAAAAGTVYYLIQYYQYQEYRVSWETDLTAGDAGAEGSAPNYIRFGRNLLKYTKDGASYIDEKGKAVWVQTYEMKAPIAVVNGSFAAVADQQGNEIYICNEDGYQGTAKTLLPITRIAISGEGVVAAVLEDSKSSYVSMFKRDGNELNLTMKSTISKNGYLMDLSFSPDGTQLICSYAYIQNADLKSRVVIYDYSEEVGQNIPDRIVSANEEAFVDKLVPRVHFMSETYSFACADTGLAFFSSENRASPVLTVQTEEERIESLFYSDKYIGLITANQEGPEPHKLVVYRENGSKVFEKGFDFDYQHAGIDGEYVFLYDDNSCCIYNMAGIKKFEGDFDFQISKITCGSLPNQFIFTGPQKMRGITFR